MFLLFIGFIVMMAGFALYSQETHVEKRLVRGVKLPTPECGWSATLVCDDTPGSECQWSKEWRCGYGLRVVRTRRFP